jgi:hypothetical protein
VSAQPESVKRELVWKGKHFKVGMCSSCGKEKSLLPPTRCGNSEKGQTKWSMLVIGGCCSQCIYRLIGDLETAVSELRAACTGGTYTEKELK